MQGRLLPPVDGRIQAFPGAGWVREFELAAEAGLACIEWLDDVEGVDTNPLNSDAGIAQLLELEAATGVEVASLCADYFQARPLVRGTAADREERRSRLESLLGRCARAGVGRIVLPFVDQSSLTGPEEEDRLIGLLDGVLAEAERRGVELHLETDLGPDRLAMLVERVPHPLVRVNYDSGNSASLGYRPDEEFAAYGDRIGSVHIKDRVRGGATVPLGHGSAALAAVFAGLARLSYDGDLILQVARGAPGNEVAWARANRFFVERALRQAA